MNGNGSSHPIAASTPLKPINKSNPTSTSTPFKPRLLWRGNLSLADGTLLDGIAFVSHQHPFFNHSSPTNINSTNQSSNSLLSQQHSDPDGEAEAEGDADADAEAEMSLALEMVRHRPLALQKIIHHNGKDESDTKIKGKGKGKEKEREKENVGADSKISYRSTGSIRM